MPEKYIRPEDLEFKGFVVATSSEMAARIALSRFGPGVYITDPFKVAPGIYGVYRADNYQFLGTVFARSAKEARIQGSRQFGIEDIVVDKISPGQTIYAIFRVRDEALPAPKPPEVIEYRRAEELPPWTAPPAEEKPPEEKPPEERKPTLEELRREAERTRETALNLIRRYGWPQVFDVVPWMKEFRDKVREAGYYLYEDWSIGTEPPAPKPAPAPPEEGYGEVVRGVVAEPRITFFSDHVRTWSYVRNTGDIDATFAVDHELISPTGRRFRGTREVSLNRGATTGVGIDHSTGPPESGTWRVTISLYYRGRLLSRVTATATR